VPRKSSASTWLEHDDAALREHGRGGAVQPAVGGDRARPHALARREARRVGDDEVVARAASASLIEEREHVGADELVRARVDPVRAECPLRARVRGGRDVHRRDLGGATECGGDGEAARIAELVELAPPVRE
jgi:hypothetical protein